MPSARTATRGPQAVARTDQGARLTFSDGTHEDFDDVVLACHGDDARALVADPTPAEREVLAAFTTTANDTWLHTDTSFLPASPRARASWNYLIGPDATGATLTYDVSRLLGLGGPETYCVTLNPHRPIQASKVLARMSYTHPLYTREAIAAQARWAEVSGPVGRHYCGAYWFYGFHEDGLRSAVRVAEALDAAW
jgi:predicted NAD/FAD-binding protein